MTPAKRPHLRIANAPNPGKGRGAIRNFEALVRSNPVDAIDILSLPLLLSELPLPKANKKLSKALRRAALVILEQAGTELQLGFDETTAHAVEGDTFVQIARERLSEQGPQPGLLRLLGHHMLRAYAEQVVDWQQMQPGWQAQPAA